MTRVWDLELPDSDKIVLLALADCANDEGHCWPSVASLVRKCSKSERTIQASIKRLVDGGYLIRREVIGKGCNYTVLPPQKLRPAENAPPQGTAQTPAAAADKPSRIIISEAEASDRVIEVWNEECEKSGLHKAKAGNNSRTQMLRLRVKAHGLETMLRAVKIAHRSEFLRGLKGDGRKADINIILQPKTLSRVLEGFYGGLEEHFEANPEEQIATLERMIPVYEEGGRPELADRARERIAALRAPVDPEMVSNVANITRGIGREKCVGRAAA